MTSLSESVRREIVIDAPPERVFEAWADPEQIARWYVERAEGDPRKAKHVAWVIGGEAEPLEVSVCEPPERLVLTNIGDEPWRGSVVDIELTPEGAGTRVVVTQSGFAEVLRDHVPNVDSGWACMLAISKEYLERYAGLPRRDARSSREFCPADVPEAEQPDPSVVSAALASTDAIARWAGERPERALATTPRGAVLAMSGIPGLFTVMGVGAVSVWYIIWGDTDLAPAAAKAEELADRLLAHVRSDRGPGA